MDRSLLAETKLLRWNGGRAKALLHDDDDEFKEKLCTFEKLCVCPFQLLLHTLLYMHHLVAITHHDVVHICKRVGTGGKEGWLVGWLQQASVIKTCGTHCGTANFRSTLTQIPTINDDNDEDYTQRRRQIVVNVDLYREKLSGSHGVAACDVPL